MIGVAKNQNVSRLARMSRISRKCTVSDDRISANPNVITSWRWTDPLALEVNFRSDVVFHNGDPLTAEDFKFSFDERPKADTTLAIGQCFETTLRPDTSWSDANKICGSVGRRLPTLSELESAMQPVAAETVEQISRVEPMKGPERLTSEVRARIEEAAPKHAPAKPKKPRKLLVMDLTIAYPPTDHLDSGSAANLALRLAGSKSGALASSGARTSSSATAAKIRRSSAYESWIVSAKDRSIQTDTENLTD